MGRYSKILVAIDRSESSRNALLQAFRLAVDEKCWITVASVIAPYTGDLDLTAVGNIRASLARPCEEALGDAIRIAEKERVLIKTVCEEGETYERIVDLADAENCGIIVMGRRSSDRFERALIGSATARVIGHTQRDVLVVPGNARLGWKKILVGTDGSRFSGTAADKAVDFARSYGSELTVLSIVDAPPELFAAAPAAVEDLVRKARMYTAEVRSRAEQAGVPAKSFVRQGEAWESIVQAAEEQAADLIVMGSHGRTGLRRLLMGSVTEKVIGSAPCPVLVAKT